MRVHVWGPMFAEFAGPGYEAVVPDAKHRPWLMLSAARMVLSNWWSHVWGWWCDRPHGNAPDKK